MIDPANKSGEHRELTDYLADFGDRLERTQTRTGDVVAGPAPARISRRRWRRPLAATAVLAVAGLVAAFLVAPAVTPVDPVSEARAALGDPGDLVHFVIVASVIVASDGPGGVNRACAQRRPTEVWQATSGTPRWRMVQPGMSKRCGTMSSWDGTVLRGPIESARNGDTQTTWYPQIGRLEVMTQTGYPDSGGYPAPLVGGIELGGTAGTSGDPIQRLRALLDQGTLREGGHSRVNGREVVHLVGATKSNTQGSESRFDLAVDARTFAPVRFTTRYITDFQRLNPRVTGSAGGWSTSTTDFVTYEQRPMNAAAARELAIQPANKPKTELRFTRAELERRIRATGSGRFQPSP